MSEFTFYDAHQSPFCLHGLVAEEGYCRVPRALLPNLRPAVQHLATETAGGRIRFATDAKEICIRLTLSDTAIKTHMTPLNMAGAEVYLCDGGNLRRAAVLRPRAVGQVPFEKLDGYTLEREIEQTVLLTGQMVTVTLYLPTFTGVEKVQVGLSEGATLRPAEPYKIEKPVVFYGSSITQGACAGRPSLSYPAQVCARLEADYWNLGFAGNAWGEKELAQFIAAMPMSAFVLDYDHNAPTVAHLQSTHRAFFETVRTAQPELPILIISRPCTGKNRADTDARFHVIEQTYLDARAKGDCHTALLDGRSFYPQGHEDLCLMDFVHPNDYGLHLMAEKVFPALKTLMELS